MPRVGNEYARDPTDRFGDSPLDTVGQIFNGVPSINTNRMETHITVANGQTLVLGGIFQTDQNQSTTRTPLLGSAPVIGGLFRHRTLRDDEQELLVSSHQP